jgi:hypothetical protein
MDIRRLEAASVNMTVDVGSIQNSLLTGFINNPDHLG